MTRSDLPVHTSVGTAHMRTRAGLLALAALLAFASLTALQVSTAGAVTDAEELVQFGSEGTGAGEFTRPTGMATDPATGHVFLADQGNSRIDEFTAWGEFVKAFGWDVIPGGATGLENCTEASGCKAGLEGSGAGQFGKNSPPSVAVDANGDIYALDMENARVEKFNSAGQFLLMFGGEVDKTTGGDVCTAASGNECQTGTVGTGHGEFSEGTGLAVNHAGTVFVGGVGRIQEFEPDGSFKSELSVAGTVNAVSGIVDAIAPEPVGSNLYVILRSTNPSDATPEDIHKLSAAGTELPPPLKVKRLRGITIDSNANVYAARTETSGQSEVVQEFSPTREIAGSCCAASRPNFHVSGLGSNSAGDLYVINRRDVGGDYITVFGPPPLVYGPPPSVPPTISAEFLSSADFTSAGVKAKINPHFWADTSYYVEYGAEDCAVSACAKVPVPPGTVKLGAGGVSKAVTTAGVQLAGLSPGATYHYRFVAQSGGGGPVFGPDATFATFAQPEAAESCPANQAFRTGFSALLPDCRAYEMVSPVDKDNGDILSIIDITGFENSLNQASEDGNALTYTSYRSFGNPASSPYISQYMAKRDPASGWSSENLEAPRGESYYTIGFSAENQYKAFSPDLCDAWMVRDAGPTLAPGAVEGFPNVYRRGNCPTSYEALSTVAPPGFEPSNYIPEPQGYSANGTKSIFRAPAKLTADGPGGNAFQVYEASGGELKRVCVFPAGTTAKTEAELPNCSAGSPPPQNQFPNRIASVSHAMSEDGSRIYWSASASGGPSGEPGKIYLRLNGTTTLPVSEAEGEGKTTKPAFFWGASADGSRALYEVEDHGKPPTAKNRNLYEYQLGEDESKGSTSLIAGKTIGVAGSSEDLSRVYFVSEEALGVANSEGEVAKAEEPNLYLHEAGANTFIATLSGADIEVGTGQVPSDASREPVFHAAKADPSGSRLAFISTNPLTGFDNTDAESGEADSEVFSYDAQTGRLSCASCSPVGARPLGRNIHAQGNSGHLWTAASIPAGENELYQPSALADDGSRLFFTSYDALIPRDTNGKADVYEWERPGAGSCKEADSAFSHLNGGCIYLISSGESPADSEFVDTGGGGRDVFFSTNASLLPQDPGLIDIYDARESGGFPPLPTPAPSCEGEACQGPLTPPNDPTPASSSFHGAGNVVEKPARKAHKKKHAKKKHRHAKKQAHRAADNNRRAAP
jgi:hypothetical protein